MDSRGGAPKAVLFLAGAEAFSRRDVYSRSNFSVRSIVCLVETLVIVQRIFFFWGGGDFMGCRVDVKWCSLVK